MAFNGGAPFGAPAQPAFGQASETPQPANPFGQTAAATSSPAFGSRITFGAAARTSKSPGTDAVATSPFGTGFGSSTGFGSGTGFGSVAGQSSAPGSINTFGTAAAPQQGFGANTGTFRAAGQSDTQAVPSQPLFGQLQTSQAQPAALNPFARLGNIAGSNSQNGLSQAQPSQTEPAAPSPFGRLGNTAASSSQNGFEAQSFGTSLSAFGTKPQDQSAQPLFGQSAQPKLSAGFGNTVSGTNPFAAATSGVNNPFASTATVPPAKGLAFGRAAKSKPQQQQQPASASGQQAQQQGEFSAGVQSQQNIGQSTKQKQKPQAQTPSNELLDPAALAARNARFASKQASQASPFANASPALNRPASPTTGQVQKRIASQPDLRHADAGQSGEQPLQSPAFLGGAPFTPTSGPSLPATLDTDAGPGDDMMPEMSVEGFCTAMCPEYQLQSRTAHANENSLEVIDPLGQGRTIEDLATKKFERNVNMSDNEALPNMFRTLPALIKTERHLMDYLDSNNPQLGLGRVSMYVWDRQRSIRQDMAWQKMEGLDVMRMYEEHAMTAIYMNSEMSHHGDPGQGDNTESYHPGLVIEQLNKTLISLTAMYETARLQGRPAPNAAEFNTYAFIMLLVGRQKDAATHFFQRHVLPYSPSPYVALALRLYQMVNNEVNPWAFFKLVEHAPYRLALWLYFLFPYVRYQYVIRLVSAAGPKQNPQPYPVSKLAQAMWSDSETDAIEYLGKAGLEPEQASSGGWQLVLHRSLKVDAQAASFRQRSARLCNQQNPVRSQNVQEQGQQAETAVQALLAGSGRQLSLPTAAPPRAAGLGSDAGQQPGVPETPQAHTRQSPAFTWPGIQTPGQPLTGNPAAQSSPAFGFTSQHAPDPSTAQKPLQPSQASLLQQQQQQQHQQQQLELQRRQQEQEQQRQQEQQRLQQVQEQQRQQQQAERLQREQQERLLQQHREQQRQAEERANAKRAHREEQHRQEKQRQQHLQQQQLAQQRQEEEQRRQQHEQQQLRQQQHALAMQQAAERQRQEREERERQQREQQKEEQAVAFHRLGLQRGCLRHWRGFTSDRKIQYGHQAIHARLAAASRQRAESSEHAVLATSQLETATLPVLLPSPSQTQSPVHLPSVLAPALAANNEGQAYLRWKAVIHYMPTAEASAHSPDFAAAKWFRQQMSFKGSGGHNTSDSDGLISLAFTDLTRASSPLLKPCQGIFTAVQDVSSLTDQRHAPGLTTATSSASALIMLITRADDPTQTQAQLAALLGASPPGLKFPLLLLTTAADLHQGVERWLAALPDRLPGFKQHVRSARVVCLADRRSSKAVGSYSQSALQAGLQWAAAHGPAQLQLKASPLERVLADELEQHLEPLQTSREVGPDGWIGVFNQMLINLWHRLNEAASKAAAIGGWPPPEIAAIDAALPQRWWQPQVLAAFEGALSSMCLPGMPASLGASPQEAVPIYVRHFLNGRASGGSWRRSLASAMHARIRAVQQQSLPHAVLLPSNLPPLFPHLAPPCRLDSTPSLAPLPGGPQRQAHNGAVVANQDWQASSLAYGSNATPQRAHPVGAVRERSGFWKTTLSNSNAEDSLALQGVSQRSAGSGQLASQGSYAAALQSGASVMPGQKQHQDSNGLHKANKRKVTDLGELETQPQGPVKRPLNGTHAKVLDLEQQTADLQKLIADSNLSE